MDTKKQLKVTLIRNELKPEATCSFEPRRTPWNLNKYCDWHCGGCNGFIAKGDNFCSNCGQFIKWK